MRGFGWDQKTKLILIGGGAYIMKLKADLKHQAK